MHRGPGAQSPVAGNHSTDAAPSEVQSTEQLFLSL